MDRAGAEVIDHPGEGAARLKGDTVTQIGYAKSISLLGHPGSAAGRGKPAAPETLKGKRRKVPDDGWSFEDVACVRVREDPQVHIGIPGNTS